MAIGSAIERARQAFAVVAQIEAALADHPDARHLQLNLSAARKRARRAQEVVELLALDKHVEICDYRLVPTALESYRLASVSQSMLNFQNLFSQVHDAVRNGAKKRSVISAEAMHESALEFGYSYSGSLGVMLFLPGDRTFFEGNLDASVDALFQVTEITDQDDVRDIARTLGIPVLRRVFDWSEVNVRNGFASDVKWRRSNGVYTGRFVSSDQMQRLVEVVGRTSDTETVIHDVVGILVGLDVKSGRFRLVIPDGNDFKGSLSVNFPRLGRFTVNRLYRAMITETRVTKYATETVDQKFDLETLEEFTSEQ